MADCIETLTVPDAAYWLGPNGYALLTWEVDFRSGGASRIHVQSPEGRDHWLEGIRLEIAEPERVVFTGDLRLDGLPETGRTVTFRRTERSEDK